MKEITVVLSAVVALFWVPIGWKFFKGWKRRSNPVSLAICSLIAYNIYALVITAWNLMTHDVEPIKLKLTLCAFSMLICAYFYISFRWSETKFKGNREKDTGNGADCNTKSTS